VSEPAGGNAREYPIHLVLRQSSVDPPENALRKRKIRMKIRIRKRIKSKNKRKIRIRPIVPLG
jgi:hypothetical protein